MSMNLLRNKYTPSACFSRLDLIYRMFNLKELSKMPSQISIYHLTSRVTQPFDYIPSQTNQTAFPRPLRNPPTQTNATRSTARGKEGRARSAVRFNFLFPFHPATATPARIASQDTTWKKLRPALVPAYLAWDPPPPDWAELS